MAERNSISKIKFTAKSANYNAIASDLIDMTTGAIGKIVYFPLVPVKDDLIKVTKADAGAGAITVDGNGKNINGSATDVINNQYTFVSYQYNGTEWRKF